MRYDDFLIFLTYDNDESGWVFYYHNYAAMISSWRRRTNSATFGALPGNSCARPISLNGSVVISVSTGISPFRHT